MWKQAEAHTNGFHPTRQQEREKSGPRPGPAAIAARQEDPNAQIMSQILLPETPANERSTGSPVPQAQTIYTSVKNTFQKKAGKPEETLCRPRKMISEYHVNLFSERCLKSLRVPLGQL